MDNNFFPALSTNSKDFAICEFSSPTIDMVYYEDTLTADNVTNYVRNRMKYTIELLNNPYNLCVDWSDLKLGSIPANPPERDNNLVNQEFGYQDTDSYISPLEEFI